MANITNKNDFLRFLQEEYVYNGRIRKISIIGRWLSISLYDIKNSFGVKNFKRTFRKDTKNIAIKMDIEYLFSSNSLLKNSLKSKNVKNIEIMREIFSAIGGRGRFIFSPSHKSIKKSKTCMDKNIIIKRESVLFFRFFIRFFILIFHPPFFGDYA